MTEPHCLIEAGKEPKQGYQPSILYDGINDPSLIAANLDRPLVKLRVVLLVWISSGVFQQLLDSSVGLSSRGLGKVGVLSVSFRD